MRASPTVADSSVVFDNTTKHKPLVECKKEMLSIPCLVVHENQYFRKKCTPDVSESTLQAALDAVANHPNCVGVTLEDGMYSGRETLELFPTPQGKEETSYNIHCSPPPPPLITNK